MVSMKEQKEKLSKIIEDNNFEAIVEKKINRGGNIYISTSKKNDFVGCSAIIIILPKEGS